RPLRARQPGFRRRNRGLTSWDRHLLAFLYHDPPAAPDRSRRCPEDRVRSRGGFMNRMLEARALTLAAAVLVASSMRAAETTPIESKTLTVDGVALHYLTAGHGEPLILIHGYAETSRMWRPVIPTFAEKFTVIAPDLPGIGDSAIPRTGLDMKTSA